MTSTRQGDAPHHTDRDTPPGCTNADQVVEVLINADAYCAVHKLRLTPVRRKTFEILLRAQKPLGAYAVLAPLDAAGFGSQPPVAYRALSFLVEHGFAHRIERLNAYVACSHPGDAHTPAFMICRSCDTVTELHAAPIKTLLGGSAKTGGFVIERTVVEAEGICPACTAQAPE